MNRKSLAVGMMIPFAAVTLVAAAPTASAQTFTAEKSGWCSKGSQWTIKAKPDNGRMEVEFEVDSNRNGQKWAVRILDNRVRVFTGYRFTHAPSGSFEVAKLTRNRPGVDHFVGWARNVRTGETCYARVNR